MEVVVVGAGVIGLSTAVRLLEAGHGVRVVTADDPAETASAVAAAVWYPYRAEPRNRVLDWGARTVSAFTELAGRAAGGVRLVELVEVVSPGAPDPWFRDAVAGFRRLARDELPASHEHGWRFVAPLVPMPTYLPWLSDAVLRRGGRFEIRRVRSLTELAGEADALVCCAGLGARDLAGDPSVTPVRGQVVVVENPGLERVLASTVNDEAPTYVIPRGADCVLGGTADAGTWSTKPNRATAAAILERCCALEPRLRGATVLAHKAGLRPARPTVRLELDDVGGTPVVHSYGHGGAGVTLSWGCADEVVILLA